MSPKKNKVGSADQPSVFWELLMVALKQSMDTNFDPGTLWS